MVKPCNELAKEVGPARETAPVGFDSGRFPPLASVASGFPWPLPAVAIPTRVVDTPRRESEA